MYVPRKAHWFDREIHRTPTKTVPLSGRKSGDALRLFARVIFGPRREKTWLQTDAISA